MSLCQPFRHALPVDEVVFHEGLYLTHAGWERVAAGSPYPQRDAPFFFFDWHEGRTLPEFCLAQLIAGEGELETRRQRSRLQAGDTFLFRPGEWHRHRPSPGTGWALMWIHFNGNDPLRWLREESFNLRGNLAVIENRELFRTQFEHLLMSVHRSPATNTANISRHAAGLLAHFLADTPVQTRRGTAKVADAMVQIAVEFIWNFSHDIVDVQAVARKVGVARRTLDRRFKAATGRTVLEEIHLCRVSRAVKLLQETDMPIKHIVHRAGFRSNEHLRLAIQKALGASPQAWRQNRAMPAAIAGDQAAADRDI